MKPGTRVRLIACRLIAEVMQQGEMATTVRVRRPTRWEVTSWSKATEVEVVR